MKSMQFQGVDGALINVIYKKAKTKIGVVHILHGMGEHAQRYEDFMTYLADHGFTVYSHDHRGHGKSLKANQDIGIFDKTDHFENIIKDIDLLQKKILEIEKVESLYVLGHSMGSLILRRYLQMEPQHVKRAVIMGTLPYYSGFFSKTMQVLAQVTGLFYAPSKRHHLLAKFMNDGLIKVIENPSSKFDWLTYNQANVETYIADPMSGFVYNKYFYQSFFKCIYQANKKSNIALTPAIECLFISGKDDPLSNQMKAIEHLVNLYTDLIPQLNTHIKTVEAARHEVLHEDNKKETYAYLKDFFELGLKNQ